MLLEWRPVDDIVVELVEPLQQVQLFLDCVQLRLEVFCQLGQKKTNLTCSVCSRPKSSSPTEYPECFFQSVSNIFWNI